MPHTYINAGPYNKGTVMFALEQTKKSQRGSTGTARLYLTSVLDGDGCSTPGPGHFTPVKDLIPIV